MTTSLYPTLQGIAEGPVSIFLDKKLLTTVEGADAAFMWLAKNQNHSVSYALQHGGYSCKPATDQSW